jgi:hypothetical protein
MHSAWNLLVRHGSHSSMPAPLALLALALALAFAPRLAQAQQLDSVRAGIQRPVAAPAAAPASAARAPRDPVSTDTLGPPITQRKAFLLSLIVPGAGQAKLDRGYAGGMFFLIEISALVLVHRSAEDYRIARRFAGDSVPLRFDVNTTTGLPVLDADLNPRVAEWSVPRYDAAYVRTRRLHYEDWLAVMIFNHLFAGADAFVAAQLWDLPTKVAVRQTPFGTAVQATVSFR